jgi:hypothetical protein
MSASTSLATSTSSLSSLASSLSSLSISTETSTIAAPVQSGFGLAAMSSSSISSLSSPSSAPTVSASTSESGTSAASAVTSTSEASAASAPRAILYFGDRTTPIYNRTANAVVGVIPSNSYFIYSGSSYQITEITINGFVIKFLPHNVGYFAGPDTGGNTLDVTIEDDVIKGAGHYVITEREASDSAIAGAPMPVVSHVSTHEPITCTTDDKKSFQACYIEGVQPDFSTDDKSFNQYVEAMMQGLDEDKTQ